MTKTLSICVTLLLLAGCEPPEQSWYYDQDLRRTILMECLQKAPAGPQATKYNDWSEVVDECGYQAERLSIVSKYRIHGTHKVEAQ